ncbi:hypothetical protein SAMN05216326_11211 [Nitrosomonas marina]|uniref:AAA+ ATPase domain-containing protein n=1 Tax=Nitrosomonas marina TaxID=917 RepID=A0A1I0BTR5_9PROT|nr:ATP-binding protein [Nitrosomonas marina]SET10508.1 hypothetical protein SAMN05216326_11211 [Nitrosomonas marina]
MEELKKFCDRAEALLDRLENFLPVQPLEPDWSSSTAFRWRRRHNSGFIQPVPRPHQITLKDLHGVDNQKRLVDQNTHQFVQGFSANNVLLTGARGTGKSSLIKAVLNQYAGNGLRLIEVEKDHLVDLHDIVEQIAQRPERFIIFCDDLTFERDEPGYKALKVVLDGSVATVSDNVLIYATSNRRHMVPEYMRDNLDTRHVGEEVHPSETVEEKISLSERFGLWVSFYPFDQDQYLEIVRCWLAGFGFTEMNDELHRAALQWALGRGSRSGRVAWQFACDFAGRQHALGRLPVQPGK